MMSSSIFSSIDSDLNEYQWKTFTASLYSDLIRALNRQELINGLDLIQQVGQRWGAWIDNETWDDGSSSRSSKLLRQWDLVRCMIWCAGAATGEKTEINLIEIQKRLSAITEKRHFVQENFGLARACLHAFQNIAPHHSLRVPIALTGVLSHDKGTLANLELEVIKPGAGGVYRHPADTFILDASYRFIEVNDEFEASIETAWQVAQESIGERSKRFDGRWRVEFDEDLHGFEEDSHERHDDDSRSISGWSASGAATLGWYHAIAGTQPDDHLIVLAQIHPSGELGGVGEIKAKTEAIVGATDGKGQQRFDTIVVASEDNFKEAIATLRGLNVPMSPPEEQTSPQKKKRKISHSHRIRVITLDV